MPDPSFSPTPRPCDRTPTSHPPKSSPPRVGEALASALSPPLLPVSQNTVLYFCDTRHGSEPSNHTRSKDLAWLLAVPETPFSTLRVASRCSIAFKSTVLEALDHATRAVCWDGGCAVHGGTALAPTGGTAAPRPDRDLLQHQPRSAPQAAEKRRGYSKAS